MSAVFKYEQELEATSCCVCGIQFGVPPYFIANARRKAGTIYCPNGHVLGWSKSEADKLREQLEQEKRNVEWYKNIAKSKDSQIKGANIQLGKVKAKLHRTERRIANGVCPCCHRSFQNVMRHMKTKHPDYVEGASQ